MKPDIHKMLGQLEYSRQINVLADALIYALNIEPGKALVPFLAPLNARDNREAVAIWVRNELQAPDVELTRQCIPVLLPRLEKALHAVEEVVW